MNKKPKVCLVSCSVLRQELEHLVNQGELDADLVFVSKYFHVEYEAVEKNLRRVLEHTLKSSKRKVVLVYGDLCIGPNGEMKKLADDYGIVKVDAVNCVGCQLGGKGKSLEADPEHNLMFMGPGMIEFFKHMKGELLKQGMDEAAFVGMFSGIKGFVLLDTCGNAEKMKEELKEAGLEVPIIETRKVGLENVRRVVFDAISTCK
ncbi:MAG: DUF1638 domain-containing protein [Candidatus Bathyarchaeia archaeon]|jgi:hypothetical protein